MKNVNAFSVNNMIREDYLFIYNSFCISKHETEEMDSFNFLKNQFMCYANVKRA